MGYSAYKDDNNPIDTQHCLEVRGNHILRLLWYDGYRWQTDGQTSFYFILQILYVNFKIDSNIQYTLFPLWNYTNIENNILFAYAKTKD